jgi:hypothetical protein
MPCAKRFETNRCRGPLILAGARGVRRSDELRRAVEADVQRVLSRPAYAVDAFDRDGEYRLLPGTAAHVRAALALRAIPSTPGCRSH